MISVVFPSYNRKDCVLNLLRDLYRQEDCGEFEVVMADDASPDDTVAAVRAEFPQVRLLVNEKNAGPCVTRNRAIEAARGDILVGVDSDVTIPDRHLLRKVAEAFAEHPEAAGFAFRIYAPDGVTDDTPRWWHPKPIEQSKERVFETDYFSGTGYAFRRDAVVRAGAYPEFLYMHYEEVVLAYRILDDGGTILYHPKLTVVHHANPVSRRGLVQVYLKPRNQILLAVNCFPAGRFVWHTMPRTLLQFFKSIRHGHVGEFLRAMRDAWKKSVEIERRPLRAETLRRIAAIRT